MAKRKAQNLHVKQDGRKGPRQFVLDGVADRHTLKIPRQADAAEWALMLAAARGADAMRTDGMAEIVADPLTMKRLPTLLPVANKLYEEHVLDKYAIPESQKIDEILRHCQKIIDAIESSKEDSDTSLEQPPATAWNKTMCQKAAQNLLFPAALHALHPVPPDAIGIHMTPQSSVWRVLRIAINRSFDDADRRISSLYNARVYNAIARRGTRKNDALQSLREISFVDAVLERAPPLVQVLPPQWTSADKTNELIEALLALLKLQPMRSLAALVKLLSEDEYDLLVKEHLCLSQLLDGDARAWSCATERNVDEYVAFARFVHDHPHFKGSLAKVPLQWPSAKPALGKSQTRPSGKREVLPGEGARRHAPSRTPGRPPKKAIQRLKHEVASLDAESNGEKQLLVPEQDDTLVADHTVSGVQQSAGDGELPAPTKWDYDWDESLAPVDLGLGVDATDEQLQEFYLPLPEGTDPMDCSHPLWKLQSEHDDWESICKLERPASRAGGFMVRSDSASAISVLPLAVAGAVAALGLVILLAAVVFRQRPRSFY